VVHDVLVGPDVGVEGPDVLPVALGHRPVDRLARRQQGREHLAGEVDRAVGLDPVEDLGLQHEDAGVDGVAEHLAPGGLLQEPLDRAVVAGDDDAELEGVLDRGEPDGGQRLALVVEADDRAQVDVGQHVTRDDQEPVLQLVHGVAHRARRAEGGLLGGVDHADAELGAVAEVVPDVVGEERHGDDDLVEAVLLQQADDVLHHRPVGDGHHRLRSVGCEGSKAGPFTPGHDHRLHAQ
jgi:hypothetical protein